MTITYIEATCDLCGELITNLAEDVDFGLLRNGKLVCKKCREKRPPHEGVKNWIVPKLPEREPEEEPTAKELLEEIEDIEESKDEP